MIILIEKYYWFLGIVSLFLFIFQMYPNIFIRMKSEQHHYFFFISNNYHSMHYSTGMFMFLFIKFIFIIMFISFCKTYITKIYYFTNFLYFQSLLRFFPALTSNLYLNNKINVKQEFFSALILEARKLSFHSNNCSNVNNSNKIWFIYLFSMACFFCFSNTSIEFIFIKIYNNTLRIFKLMKI